METAEEAHDPGHGHGELDLVTVFTAGGTRRMSAREYDRVFRRGRGELLCSFAQPERLWRLVEGWQGVSPDEESDGAENDGYGDSRVSGRYAGRERARL